MRCSVGVCLAEVETRARVCIEYYPHHICIDALGRVLTPPPSWSMHAELLSGVVDEMVGTNVPGAVNGIIDARVSARK